MQKNQECGGVEQTGLAGIMTEKGVFAGPWGLARDMDKAMKVCRCLF